MTDHTPLVDVRAKLLELREPVRLDRDLRLGGVREPPRPVR